MKDLMFLINNRSLKLQRIRYETIMVHISYITHLLQCNFIGRVGVASGNIINFHIS